MNLDAPAPADRSTGHRVRVRQAGFTLLELNIAMAIAALLAALAVPAYQDYLERARLAAVMLQVDAMREKAQTYVASRGLDLCRWQPRKPSSDAPDDFGALAQIVKEGFEALDPAGRQWPRTMNLLAAGKAPLGPVIQIIGRGPNAHRAHLLRQELERAALVDHVSIDRPTMVAFIVRLGQPCP